MGAAAIILLAALPAHAVRCREWTELKGEAREDAITVMVEDRMQSQRAKKYQINTAALRQCLLNSSQRIAIDFDYTCAQGMKAKVSALDDVLKQYISRCLP